FWSCAEQVHADVQAALREALPGALVLCHISHVYETGCSLYFTVATKETADPLPQWLAAKAAASDAIVAAGATITHHHAVGTDHAPYMEAEVGGLGVEALRAIKDRLDPAGIMNPGKLLPG
ncbi:MAG: FAD-linked oxidase C-terminal domain-containing protein, partial [Solirubrobacterales bacterium]